MRMLPRNLVKEGVAILIVMLGLLRLGRWLRIQVLVRPRITLLCYHRITAQGALISPQCISPVMFDMQIRHLTSHYQIISLDDVADYLRGDFHLETDAIAVTFDDGYQDNYTEALPILAKYGVLACFFVASAPLLDDQSYWIDDLSVLLEAIHGTNTTFSLAELPTLAQQITEFIGASATTKRKRAKDIFLALNRLGEQQKYAVLSALRTACQAAGCKPGTTPALMTAEQLLALAHAGQHIGAHTVSHPRLSNLEPDEVVREITNGLDRLRQHVGGVHYFAYPFGKLADIPKDHAALFTTLETSGIDLAVTTEDGVVAPDDHRYLVPRTVMSAQSLAMTQLKLERLAWQR